MRCKLPPSIQGSHWKLILHPAAVTAPTPRVCLHDEVHRAASAFLRWYDRIPRMQGRENPLVFSGVEANNWTRQWVRQQFISGDRDGASVEYEGEVLRSVNSRKGHVLEFDLDVSSCARAIVQTHVCVSQQADATLTIEGKVQAPVRIQGEADGVWCPQQLCWDITRDMEAKAKTRARLVVAGSLSEVAVAVLLGDL